MSRGFDVKVRKPYPRNSDIVEALKEVLSEVILSPDELPQRVRARLEEKGFYAGLVSDKRVWSLYEKLVREGRLPDSLGVVQGLEELGSMGSEV
ncbi:MAG: hypothetical protein QXD46_02660 [Thermofilum sp.]